MRTTFILHGCADDWDPAPQAMRMYVSTERLRGYLQKRDTPFVDPDEDRDGDVLTIDDSTRGAAHACLMARELGHAVTLFVNPSQIISGRDYWFSRFDAIVDARRATMATFADKAYDLASRQGLYDFRWAVRPHLVGNTEAAAHRLLDEVAVLLDACDAPIPDFARSIDTATFATLRDAGVRFGNHGWDHQCVGRLSAVDQLKHIVDTADWVQQQTGHRPRDYAIPFGQARLAPAARAAIAGDAYLVGPISTDDGHYHPRKNLTPELQTLYR